MRTRVHRFVAVVIATLGLAGTANAASMSDLWWNPAESGWGANIIEQQGTLFVTIFVYGQDGRPAWYVGPNTTLQSSTPSLRTYAGALYVTTGPSFAGAFNPAAVQSRQVGSLTFTASSPIRGTLTYSVDGVTVTRAVQRQTWKHISLTGTYHGALDPLAQSTCPVADSQHIYTTQTITATVSSSGLTGSMTMVVGDTFGDSMTFAGTYAQYGSLFEMQGTLTYAGVSLPAAITDFTADDDGIRGNLVALGANSCTLNMRFAAVRPG